MPTRRVVRVGFATLAASFVTAGLVAGFGSRLAMFAIRLLNDSHNGETTHAGAVVGAWTFDGTLALVIESLFFAPVMFVIYLVVRPILPTRLRTRVLTSAAFASVVGAPMVIDPTNYEYYRYTSPRVALAMFVVLLPTSGALLSLLAERWSGGGRPQRPRRRSVDIVWSGIVVALTALPLAHDVRMVQSIWSHLV